MHLCLLCSHALSWDMHALLSEAGSCKFVLNPLQVPRAMAARAQHLGPPKALLAATQQLCDCACAPQGKRMSVLEPAAYVSAHRLDVPDRPSRCAQACRLVCRGKEYLPHLTDSPPAVLPALPRFHFAAVPLQAGMRSLTAGLDCNARQPSQASTCRMESRARTWSMQHASSMPHSME